MKSASTALLFLCLFDLKVLWRNLSHFPVRSLYLDDSFLLHALAALSHNLDVTAPAPDLGGTLDREFISQPPQ